MADFFFRTTKFGYYLLIIPKNLRYVVTALTLIMLITTWFFFAYLPLQSGSNYYNVLINQLNAEQACESKKVEENLLLKQLLRKKKKEYQQSYQLYQKQYKSFHDTLVTIFNNATAAKLTIQSHIPLQNRHEDWYSIYSCKTDFKGNFSSLIMFLEHLTKNSALVQIPALTITKDREQNLITTCNFNFFAIKEDGYETTMDSNPV